MLKLEDTTRDIGLLTIHGSIEAERIEDSENHPIRHMIEFHKRYMRQEMFWSEADKGIFPISHIQK